MKMMDYTNHDLIYIGSHYPSELREEFKDKKAYIDYPGDVLQQAILKGIDDNGLKVQTLSMIKILRYPAKDRINFKPMRFSHLDDGSLTDLYVGCINLPVLNRISSLFRMSRFIRGLTRKNKDKKNILVYGLPSPVLMALWLNRPRLGKVAIIVTDLPEYMTENKHWSYRAGKAIDHIIIKFLLKRVVDKYVLLSPYMRERLPVNDKPWMQMEGIFCNLGSIKHDEKDNYKTILYTGNLGRRYGILDLLHAFELIDDPAYKLLFCGVGDSVEEIKNVAEKDNRVEYLGVLPRNEVLRLQQRATLLVNPRHREEVYTKYSFPSKTMEYLASGTPTLMSHLDSIPQEYDSHLFYFDDESIEGMSRRIEEICSLPEASLKEFGRKASEFILTQKNPKVQMRRVLEFINHN